MPSRVLLAVADSQFRRAATEALAAAQIQSISADDGNTAFGLLNALPPDVLVAEIALPGKDGYALCQHIRQSPALQSLPVVLLDGQFDAINRKIASRVGATIYLSQPFTSSELVEVVRRFVENKAEAGAEATDAAPVRVAATDEAAEAPQPVSFEVSRPQELPSAKVATQTPSTELALEPYKQNAALMPRDRPPRRPRRGYFMFYAAAFIIVLTGIAAAIWLRTRPAEGQLSLAQPAISESSPDDARAMAGRPDSAPTTAPVVAANESPEVAPPEPSSETPPPAPPPIVRAARRAPSPIANPPHGRPKVEVRRQEPRPAATAPPIRQGSPAAAPHRPPDTPAARPPNVKSNTIGGQWRKGGQEIAAAGEHFASGVKHVGKGGAKLFLWLGKKIGSGFKRIGKALK